MQSKLMYIELKSGYRDNGPAWIGIARFSKSGRTVYFNNCAFQKVIGISGNHQDLETGEEYWISGVKKNGEDRHWAGSGKIMIDRKVVSEYLETTGQRVLDHRRFEVVDIPDEYPNERIHEIENQGR